MLIKELGEFGLIERIKESLNIKSIDDTAILPLSEDKLLLFTTDMFIEGVHFERSYASPYQIGWKAIAAGLSDIAAMGGLPRYGLISLAIPPSFHLGFVDELYSGMKDLAYKLGLDLVGGDTNGFEKLVIDISLIGECKKDHLVKRSGAKVGDKIVVSGWIGDSNGGLLSLKRGMPLDSPSIEILIKRHLQPFPRLKEARELVKANISAMIDLSDGLSMDLYQLTKESGVGARIFLESIPISKELSQLAERMELDPVELALSGGEDYELLFTTPYPSNLPRLKIPLTIIGQILPSEDGHILVDREGKESRLPLKGYDHLKPILET